MIITHCMLTQHVSIQCIVDTEWDIGGDAAGGAGAGAGAGAAAAAAAAAATR